MGSSTLNQRRNRDEFPKRSTVRIPFDVAIIIPGRVYRTIYTRAHAANRHSCPANRYRYCGAAHRHGCSTHEHRRSTNRHTDPPDRYRCPANCHRHTAHRDLCSTDEQCCATGSYADPAGRTLRGDSFTGNGKTGVPRVVCFPRTR